VAANRVILGGRLVLSGVPDATVGAEAGNLAPVRNSTRSGAYALARVLNTIGLAIVAVIVIYILLTLLEANPDNTAATLIRELAEYFNLGLANLFLVAEPTWMIGLNYGVAALIWLVLTTVVVRLVRRIG
jgi:hypothetical protein